MNQRLLWCGLFLLGGLVITPPTTAQNAPQPLNKLRLMSLVIGGPLDENIRSIVARNGLSFQPTPEYAALLRKAGTSNELMVLVEQTHPQSVAKEDPNTSELLAQLVDVSGLNRSRHYREAASSLSAAARKYPDNLELAFVMARILVLTDQGELAAALYSELESRAPDFPQLHTKYAGVLATMEQPEAAVLEAEAALRVDSSDADAHKNLGLALADEGKFGAALVEYQEALRLKPDYGKAHFCLALLYSAIHDRDGEISEYRKAIALEPNEYDYHYDLGNALHDRGDLDGAIAEFRAAKQIDPIAVRARHNLGLALVDKNQIAAAEEEFRSLTQTNPDFGLGHCGLGLILRSEHNPKAALEEYLTAARLDPGSPCSHLGAGHSYEDLKQFKEAVDEYRQAAVLDPSNPYPYSDLGLLLLRELKDPVNAIMFMRQAIILKPEEADFHKSLAEMLDATGEAQSAIGEYTEAERLDPRNASLRTAKAKLLEKQGEYAAALEEYGHAAELDGSLMPQYKAAEQNLNPRIQALKHTGDKQAATIQ